MKRPLLQGKLAERARDTVRALARRLARGTPGEIWPSTLGGGDAGIALFLARAAQVLDDPALLARASRVLHRAIDALAAEPSEPSLFGGFSGIAWTVEQLTEPGAPDDEDDPNLGIDEAAFAAIEAATPEDPFDLVAGHVGLGIYALERLPRASARTALVALVDHFERTREVVREGVTWRSLPDWMPPVARRDRTEPYYDLGLAHGVPGIIVLLSRCALEGVERERALAMVSGAVAWMLAQRGRVSEPSAFPAMIGPTIRRGSSRTAWCYGDPGVAASLLLASRAANDPTWRSLAIELAVTASARDVQASGVLDAGLCHGSAGLAHVYHRLARDTGDARLTKAARTWFGRTLDAQTPGRGLAGYRAWNPSPSGDFAWVNDPSWLTGAAGIGLALVSALTRDDPTWDRALGLSG